jgi:hypothetical protein
MQANLAGAKTEVEKTKAQLNSNIERLTKMLDLAMVLKVLLLHVVNGIADTLAKTLLTANVAPIQSIGRQD